jgi:preprotein translocase subunit YajC
MKEILDFIVIVIFVFFVASFIIGFNKQQIQKHKDKLDEIQKQKNKEKEK